MVVAVDVGARDRSDLYNYGDAISGWWLLWKKWWPWTESVRVPDLNDVQFLGFYRFRENEALNWSLKHELRLNDHFGDLITVEITAPKFGWPKTVSELYLLANVSLNINPKCKARFLEMRSSVRNYLFLEKCLKNPFQSRLAYIACSHLLDEVIGSDYCFYIRNDDIQKFKTLDFDKFDEILDFGYEFAKVKITDDWVDSLLTKNKGIYGLTWPSDLISLLMAN